MQLTVKPLDTLKIYERLKKVKTSDAQARELAEIMGELVDNHIASKNDLKSTDTRLQESIKKTDANLQDSIKKSEVWLEDSIKKTEAKLEADLKNTELKLQTEIQKSKTEILKWVIGWTTGLIFAQTGMLITFIKFSF